MPGVAQTDSGADDDEEVIVCRKKSSRAVVNDSEEENDFADSSAQNTIISPSKQLSFDNNSREKNEENIAENSVSDSNFLTSHSKLDQQSQIEIAEPIRHHPIALTDDVFDAEGESDSEVHVLESGGNSNLDEDSNEIEISLKLKRRLAKGAAKVAKPSKSTPHSRQNELNEIHKESQRLVRESSVRLPYHKPPKLDLSVFLSRTEQKQQRLASISSTPHLRPSWKDITATSLLSTASSDLTKTTVHLSSDASSSQPSSILTGEAKDPITGSTGNTQELSGVSRETVPSNLVLDEDELPDLVIEVQTTVTDGCQQFEPEKASASPVSDSVCAKFSVSNVSVNDMSQKNFPDILASLAPLVDSSKVNSDISESVENVELSEPVSLTTEAKDDLKLTATCRRTSNVKKYSYLSDNIQPSLGTPQLNNENAFIDLDDEGFGQVTTYPKINPGVSCLVERLIKHSPMISAKKSRNVEITTVSKESVDGNRQELKVEKLVYSLDDEEDECNPLLNKPGAKLMALQKRLRASMKVKREELLEKRYKLFEQEHQGSYEMQRMEEDPKLEEEELTDQTDTEDEEESEDNEELEDEEEKAFKRNPNPFVDEEAEDDDLEDDDDDEDGESSIDEDDDHCVDKMSKKTENDYTSDNSLSHNRDIGGDEDTKDNDSVKKSDLSSSAKHNKLVKTKTLDLFDEDANTDAVVFSGSDANVVGRNSFKQIGIESNDVIEYSSQIKLLDPMETDNKEEEFTTTSVSLMRDSSFASADSSFDMINSLIPAGQKCVGKSSHPVTQLSQPSSFLQNSKYFVSQGETNEKSSADNHFPKSVTKSSVVDESTSLDGDFHLYLEESQTQNTYDRWSSKNLLKNTVFEDSNLPNNSSSGVFASFNGTSQTDDASELLALCSGSFGRHASDAPEPLDFNHFAATSTQSGSNLDELIGLCSGEFTSIKSSNQSNIVRATPASSSNFYVSKGLLSQDDFIERESTADDSPLKKNRKKKRLIVSDDEDTRDKENFKDATNLDMFDAAEDSGDDGHALSDDDNFSDGGGDELTSERGEEAKRFKGFTGKHGKIRKEFVEDEAELSGSECESDEDMDLDEKDDFLEEEAGDQDDLGTEDEIRNQVHRVHLKTLIDEDAREIRLLQEQYLPNGDLESDGTGRMRRFRWNTIDEDDASNLIANNEEEKEDDEGENEAKWRTERLEREKFLKEFKESESTGTGSHLMRLGQVVFHQKPDIFAPNNQSPTLLASKNSKDSVSKFKVPVPSYGSFLSRNKAMLAKLAETTKPLSNPHPTRNSRKFVFSTISSPEHKEKIRKAETNITPTSTRPPPKKKLCPERRNSLPPNSIFTLMDKAS